MRRALSPALLLPLLLAGCASPEGILSASSGDLVGDALRFAEAVAMPQASFGAEPNIAILPDGTMFIAAVAGSQEQPNAMTGAAWLWRSTDGGATWETLRSPVRETPLGAVPPTRRPFGSSDADVVTSADGWVYYSDWWNWGAPVIPPTALPEGVSSRYGSYLVERSSDGGRTWQSAPITTIDSVGGIDRQWLVAGDDGLVGLFYAYFHGPQNVAAYALDAFDRSTSIMSIQAVWSKDHGATWGRPMTVVPPVQGQSYQIAHPRHVGGGVFVMPYGQSDTGAGEDEFRVPSTVRLAVGLANGTRWASRHVADAPQGFENLWAVQGAVDGSGRVVVAWSARAGDVQPVFVAESADLGESWTEPLAVRGEGTNVLPWVAATPGGRVALAWYGSDATGDPRKAPAETAWYPYVATQAAPREPFAVARATDAPVKLGAMCPRGAACTSERELLDYASLDFGPDGALHLAFARSEERAGAKLGLVSYTAALGLP